MKRHVHRWTPFGEPPRLWQCDCGKTQLRRPVDQRDVQARRAIAIAARKIRDGEPLGRAPKIRCPMSGRQTTRMSGGHDQCEHCGKLVFIGERTYRTAIHTLPASMARAVAAGRLQNETPDL